MSYATFDINGIAYMLRCMPNLKRFNLFLGVRMRELQCYRQLFNGYMWENVVKRYAPCLSTFEFQMSVLKSFSNLELDYIVNSFQYFVKNYPNWNMFIHRWIGVNESPGKEN